MVRYAVENRSRSTREGRAQAWRAETLGPGLVIDFSRHFRRIVDDRVPTRGGAAGGGARRPERQLARWGGGSVPIRIARRRARSGG